MKVTLEQLWTTGGALQRFGQLKLKGRAIAWKAGRIHQSAMREIEKLQKARQEMEEIAEDLRQQYGIEVERRDMAGNIRKVFEVSKTSDHYREWKQEAKKLEQEWEKSLQEVVEIWGDPFKPDDLPIEFWGQDEDRDQDGKVKPAIESMMTPQDIGALSEWMIAGDATEKARTASGD